MSGVKQGFWERVATDQKAKRTNEYLSAEVRGLVATSDGPGRYDSIQLTKKIYLVNQREKKAVDFVFSSAEVKEHTKSYVTATLVTQKMEKISSYLLFARLSARPNPSSNFVVKTQKTHENVCFLCLAEPEG